MTRKDLTLKKFNVDQLTDQQSTQLDQIEKFINHHLQNAKSKHAVGVISGEAGTGKSVILTKLFQKIQQGRQDTTSPYFRTNNVFTVNHPELLKVYQELAATLPALRKKDYVRPTSLINQAHKQRQKYDVVVIDEGHLLLSKPEPYIKFTQQNQLDEIIKLAKVVIVVFDFKQVMQTKMYWDQHLLNQILAPYHTRYFNLTMQYRMQAPASVMNWVNALSDGNILPLPSETGRYDLRIYRRAIDMYQQIQDCDKRVGLSRIVATTGFVRKNQNEHHVYMDDFDLPWDEYDIQPTPWAQRPASIHEVGSIYTVQGFDLNYVGVILGPPFEYDAQHDCMIVNPSKVTHTEIYKKRPDLTHPEKIAWVKQRLMFNVIDVLLKRGIYELYITAADEKLRQRLLLAQDKKQ